MKKIRKGKKKLIITVIAIVVAIIAVILIVNIIKKNQEKQMPTETEKQQVIPLPETTYSDMKVTDIQMEYLKENDETMITFRINNTTSAKVENKKFNAILIGNDENVLGQMGPIVINSIDKGEEQEFSVIYKGDLTSTKQIKLKEIN